MVIKCPKCDSENTYSARFCSSCAAPLPDGYDVVHTKTIETPRKEITTGSIFAGRYQIIEELGKGGMGKVFKVLDKETKEKIALKLIKPEIASDKKTIERFKNELTIARKIRHKNVCGMYYLGGDKGSNYITMEYVPGEDLKSSIRRFGSLPIGKTISIAKQICDGLQEAHSLGIVHRDLKPNNIMIDDNGNARIMDFGIARTVKGKGITGSGVMIGTPEYMSPEQAEAKEVDQRSDIYSLGVILYELTTGHLPFEGDTPLAIAMKHKSEIPKNPKDFNSQIPDDLSRVILKCLVKNKETRFQSTRELNSDLKNIEKGLPTSDRAVPRKKPLTSKEMTVTFSLKKLYIPLALLLIVVAALVLFLGRSPKLDPDRVVVATFINQTGDPGLDPLGRRAADLVSLGLKAIGSIEVAPIADLDLGQEKYIGEKHFRRIAKNSKAGIVIVGEYFQQEKNLNFHSNIYNANQQKLLPSPEPILGQTLDPSSAIERLRDNLMSAVLSIHDPRMAMWLNVSSYVPKHEALVEYIKGMELFFRYRKTQSIENFDRANEIDQNYPLPLFFAALAHRDFSIKAQYIEKINQLPSLSQGERYFSDWLKAHQEGDNESKFRIMQQQEALAPGTMHSYQLGEDAMITNRPQIAIEALGRLDPESIFAKDFGTYWWILTRSYHMIGNHKQELKEALMAQKLFPQSWDPLEAKIRALSALGKLDKVHKVLEESYAKPQTNYWFPARLMGIAFEEFKAHGFDDAAAKMSELSLPLLKNKNAEEGISKYSLALNLFYTSKWIEAKTLFEELHESNPKSLTYLGALGIFAARTGDSEEALRISELLTDWDKPYVFGRHTFWQAAIVAALGEKDKAVSLLRTAISQGYAYYRLYCRMELEPLWDYPAFIELIKPRD